MDDLPRPGQSARDDDFADNADQDYEFIDGVGDEDQDGQDGESGDDLHALLNVSKTASVEEIKAAYKRLSMIFHPDKHQRQEDKERAERQFQRIHTAYEILTDASKRAVYDLYGLDGVNRMGTWSVGQRLQTPAEIRAEFERMKLRFRQTEVERLVKKSQGKIELSVDATNLFDSYARELRRQENRSIGLAELLMPEVTGLQLTQSTEVDLENGDRVDLSGVIVSRNGRGGGYLIFGYHRNLSSRRWVQANVAVGSTNFASLKFGGEITKESFGSVNLTWMTWPSLAPPMVEVTVGRMLGQSTHGNITYKSGEWALGRWGRDYVDSDEPSDAVEVGINHKTGKHSYGANIQAGMDESYVALKYTFLVSKSVAVRSTAKASTTRGLSMSVGADRTIFSRNNRIGAALQLATAGGIILKLKISRFAQTLSIPVTLSDVIDYKVLGYGVAVPVTVGWLLHRYWIGPAHEKSISERMSRARERAREQIERKRQDATDAVDLMRQSINRKIDSERSVRGLVIESAQYGIIGSSDPAFVIDVTIPVQMAVTNSQLFIAETTKSTLLGFYDPCPWRKDKQLKVTYYFRDQLHEVLVADDESLSLPMRAHLVG